MAKAQTKILDPPPKIRKEWRDPEGSIIRKTVKQRDRFGKLTQRHGEQDQRVEGKRREKKRLAPSASDAVTLRRALQLEIETELNPPPVEEKRADLTFNEVLDYFEKEFVKAAVIANDQKIEG